MELAQANAEERPDCHDADCFDAVYVTQVDRSSHPADDGSASGFDARQEHDGDQNADLTQEQRQTDEEQTERRAASKLENVQSADSPPLSSPLLWVMQAALMLVPGTLQLLAFPHEAPFRALTTPVPSQVYRSVPAAVLAVTLAVVLALVCTPPPLLHLPASLRSAVSFLTYSPAVDTASSSLPALVLSFVLALLPVLAPRPVLLAPALALSLWAPGVMSSMVSVALGFTLLCAVMWPLWPIVTPSAVRRLCWCLTAAALAPSVTAQPLHTFLLLLLPLALLQPTALGFGSSVHVLHASANDVGGVSPQKRVMRSIPTPPRALSSRRRAQHSPLQSQSSTSPLGSVASERASLMSRCQSLLAGSAMPCTASLSLVPLLTVLRLTWAPAVYHALWHPSYVTLRPHFVHPSVLAFDAATKALPQAAFQVGSTTG